MKLVRNLCIPFTPVQVISQVNGNENAGGGGVDAHVIRGVVQKLGPGVALNVMGVVVSPSQLDVNPVFLCGGAVHHVSVGEQAVKNKDTVLYIRVK